MDKVKKKAYKMLAMIRNDVAEVVQYEDLISTKSWDPSEMVIIAKPALINLIKNEIRYNIYNSYAASNDGIGNLKVQDEVRPIGQLDGIDVYVSKFLPENVELIIQIKGTAKEIFAMKKHLNFDKVPGILTYKMSLEYQGGTGVFFP
ncbi:MAG: hypothetical protein E7Y34_02915, partial [Mycoplasma sp.]|nr:hypothetical protein [Mycoplasma sp.]